MTTPFVPDAADDPRLMQQLSAAAEWFMEAGEFPNGASRSELLEEDGSFVAALSGLDKYFEFV